MRRVSFIRSAAGVVAVAVASAVAAPGTAQAQVLCFDSLNPFPVYYGCEEGGGEVAATGQLLSAIGDGFVQQQLNVAPGIAGFAAPTGRLRHTSHDGLREKNSGERMQGFEIDEASVFANVAYDLPGTWFGGRVRINGLAGYGHLRQDSDVPGAAGFKSEIDSFIYGGSYLWSSGSFYTMTLIIGISGEVDGTAVAGAPYSYDISGYFTNSVIGYTFTLPGANRFDLRGALGHSDISGDRFATPDTNAPGTFIKAGSEAWSGSLTGTFFTLVDLDGATLRPYILGSYKHVFDEDIEIRGDFVADFEQANDYGRVEIGFDYVKGAVTYGAAAYTEFSADENTVGARLGASIKLQ